MWKNRFGQNITIPQRKALARCCMAVPFAQRWEESKQRAFKQRVCAKQGGAELKEHCVQNTML